MNTIKAGQTFNEVCPFTEEHTGKCVEVVEVKAAANGKPAALVRIVSSNDKNAIGFEFGVYITDGQIDGYEEDLFSVATEEEQPAAEVADLGNNESLTRGVFDNQDGTFTALTFTQSKTFKTRKGADNWYKRKTAA